MKDLHNATKYISKNISTSGWLSAIAEAESQLQKLKRREGRLKAAIRIFKARHAKNEPFPAA